MASELSKSSQPLTANGSASKFEPQRDEQVSYVDHAIERTGVTIGWAAERAKATLDKVVPPEKSNAMVESLQDFASTNPKLATFLGVNAVFTGVPLLLFAAFSVSVLIFSLITGLIMGIVGALVFTSSIVGVALIFVVPTVLLTTIIASTLFFWTIVGLYLYSQVQRRNR